MSLRIYVDAYSGYRANERPRQFSLDDDVVEIAHVEDRWYDATGEYFKVRTTDGKIYLLRCDTETSEWTLHSSISVKPAHKRSSFSAKSSLSERFKISCELMELDRHVCATSLRKERRVFVDD